MADINIGTQDAPLYVPEGSAGHQNYLANIVKTGSTTPTPSASPTTPTVDSLNTASPINLGSTYPTTTVDTAGAAVAGANSTSKSLEDYLKELTAPKSDVQTKTDKLTEDV